MKLKMIAAALSLLSLSVFAVNLRNKESDKSWIIPNSHTYISYQSNILGCGSYYPTNNPKCR